MDEAVEVLTRRKLSADEFERMAETGILGPDDRIELIDGELIDMSPIGQGHSGMVSGLNQALVLACVGKGIVSVQSSIRLDHLNMPEPDFTVLRYRPDFYAAGSPAGAADVLLVVEVADSSLQYDRRVKMPLYARLGLPEYWIVDIKGRRLDRHLAPAGGGYGTVTAHECGERLALAAAPEIVVPLELMFG